MTDPERHAVFLEARHELQSDRLPHVMRHKDDCLEAKMVCQSLVEVRLKHERIVFMIGAIEGFLAEPETTHVHDYRARLVADARDHSLKIPGRARVAMHD